MNHGHWSSGFCRWASEFCALLSDWQVQVFVGKSLKTFKLQRYSVLY